MDHGNGYFWGMHFLWWTAGLFVLIGIFWFLYNTSLKRLNKDDSLQILKRRFANGKISKEEYEAAKKILEEDL